MIYKREIDTAYVADVVVAGAGPAGICAAVAAAIENGLCSANETVTVKTRGGHLLVKYTYDNIFLTGNAEMIFTGTTEF